MLLARNGAYLGHLRPELVLGGDNTTSHDCALHAQSKAATIATRSTAGGLNRREKLLKRYPRRFQRRQSTFQLGQGRMHRTLISLNLFLSHKRDSDQVVAVFAEDVSHGPYAAAGVRVTGDVPGKPDGTQQALVADHSYRL
jgi:hypothetical protein